VNKLPDLIEELRMLLGRNVTSAGFIRDRAIAELTRLRQIEADAKAAGQITRDGKFARLGMKVWHPKHAKPSECFIEHPEDGFSIEIEEGEKFFYCPVSDCYSTREAAEAAREEKA
jgi:hypothetical protein